MGPKFVGMLCGVTRYQTPNYVDFLLKKPLFFLFRGAPKKVDDRSAERFIIFF